MECQLCLQEGLHTQAEYRVHWCGARTVTTNATSATEVCGMCGYETFRYKQVVAVQVLVAHTQTWRPDWIPQSAAFLPYEAVGEE